MTNQQGAPDALTDFERRHAIRQGYEIAASDGYFEARPQIDSNDRRKVFQAGFERGWDRHAALVEAQQPATHVQQSAEIEHVAGDVSKNGAEANMAQQPASSAAAADPCPGCIPGGYCRTPKCGRLAALNAAPRANSAPVAAAPFQQRVQPWLLSALRAVWCGEAVPPVASPIANAAADSQPAADESTAMSRTRELAEAGRWPSDWVEAYRRGYSDRAARAPADSVTAPAGGADWQDISTAPKDGTRFVAVGQNYGLDSEAQHTCIAQWLAGCWVEVSDWNGASKLKYLTHWMPLPPLPCSAARTPADSVLEDAQTALRKVLGIVQRYLPPDGPSAHDAMSEITAIVDPWPLGPLEKP